MKWGEDVTWPRGFVVKDVGSSRRVLCKRHGVSAGRRRQSSSFRRGRNSRPSSLALTDARRRPRWHLQVSNRRQVGDLRGERLVYVGVQNVSPCAALASDCWGLCELTGDGSSKKKEKVNNLPVLFFPAITTAAAIVFVYFAFMVIIVIVIRLCMCSFVRISLDIY